MDPKAVIDVYHRVCVVTLQFIFFICQKSLDNWGLFTNSLIVFRFSNVILFPAELSLVLLLREMMEKNYKNWAQVVINWNYPLTTGLKLKLLL